MDIIFRFRPVWELALQVFWGLRLIQALSVTFEPSIVYKIIPWRCKVLQKYPKVFQKYSKLSKKYSKSAPKVLQKYSRSTPKVPQRYSIDSWIPSGSAVSQQSTNAVETRVCT